MCSRRSGRTSPARRAATRAAEASAADVCSRSDRSLRESARTPRPLPSRRSARTRGETARRRRSSHVLPVPVFAFGHPLDRLRETLSARFFGLGVGEPLYVLAFV